MRNGRGTLVFIIVNVVVTFAVASAAILLWQQNNAQNSTEPTAGEDDAASGEMVVIVTVSPGASQTPWIVTATVDPAAAAVTPTAIAQAPTVAPTLDATSVLQTLEANTGEPLAGDADDAAAESGADSGAEPGAEADTDTGAAAAGGDGTYTVQEGDSPAIIAENLGIDLADLLCANDLGTIDEPEFIFPEQVLIVPGPDFVCEEAVEVEPTVVDDTAAEAGETGGADTAEDSALATVPAEAFTNRTPQPTLTLPSVVDEPVVAIIQAIEPGSLSVEGIEIRNLGGLINLEDWTLTDRQGNIFTFPDYRLFPNSGVTVFTRAGTDTPVALFWGLTESVWEEDDTAILLNANGDAQSIFQLGGGGVPTAVPGVDAQG